MPPPEPIIHPRSIRLAAVLLIVAVLVKTGLGRRNRR